MINFRKKSIKIIAWTMLFILVVPIFTGCGEKPTQYLVELEVWGVFDDANDYSEVISAYRKINPFVTNVVYKKFTIENYKEDLLDALAAGNGPDIFMINNAWMPNFENKVAAAPEYLINKQQFLDNFVDVVADDFIGIQNEIYGAPLSVDSLALYYNKDLFKSEAIAVPPQTWEEVIEDTKKITKIDDFGKIYKSGISLGTAENINRPSDIINLLLFQHGVTMPTKEKTPLNVNNDIGAKVLEFYTQFARSSSPSYSWNKNMHYSIDAFYEGDLAMMINYSWHIETLKAKNAKLDFAIAPVPQISSENHTNNANYWSFVVNQNKKINNREGSAPISNEERIHEAWQFLKYLTFNNKGSFNIINIKSGNSRISSLVIDPADAYLKKTEKPAARRDLAEKQKTDPLLGAFAKGNIMAKSWYRKNDEIVEGIWNEAIESVNRGDIAIGEAFILVKSRINEINR